MPFHSPGLDESIMEDLWSSELMSCAEWTSYASAEGFTLVTVDGYTWFSLASVGFHLWIHKPSELKIRMHCLDEDSYAYGVHLCFVFQHFNTDDIEHYCSQTIYPNVALNNVKNAFRHSLELTKALILTTLGNLE